MFNILLHLNYDFREPTGNIRIISNSQSLVKILLSKYIHYPMKYAAINDFNVLLTRLLKINLNSISV